MRVDKEKTLRTIIVTLQDLNFVIDNADLTLGTVTGTKVQQWMLKMTVSVRPRGRTQLLVRANAQFNLTTVFGADSWPCITTGATSVKRSRFFATH